MTASSNGRSYGWQALDSARDQRFTGALVIDVGEEIRLFFDLGALYLAERATDPRLPDRLLAVGVVTADELERGMVRVGEVDHLGRLFDRAPSIDRDRVITAIDLMNDEVLGSMASREVLAAEALPYRHHPSGIQRWTADAADEADTADTADTADEVATTDRPAEPTLAPPEPTPVAVAPVAPTGSPLPPPPPMPADDVPPAPTLPAPTVAEPTAAVTDSIPAGPVVGPSAEPAAEMAPIGLGVGSLADAIAIAPAGQAEPVELAEVAAPDAGEPMPDAVATEETARVEPLVAIPIGPQAAADAVISWDEPAGHDDPGVADAPVVDAPVADAPSPEPLIRPLAVPTASSANDPAEPAAVPTPSTLRRDGIPNLPTGAERRTRRALEISSDWTVGLDVATDTDTAADVAGEVIESASALPVAAGDDDHDGDDDRRDDHHDDDRDLPGSADAPPIDHDRSSSELSIQIVWPSGDIDPRSADDAPAARARSGDRTTPGGSARLAVGRSASAAEPDAGTAPDDAAMLPPSTAASEAVVFEIDWSLGATPPPIGPPDEQAADVLDDVMHAVRRTVAACETRVARTHENTRSESLGSLASLGGVMPAQPGHSVFDDVMTPTFAMPAAGQSSGEDRSGALKRLIGSLKRP